jgi:purine-nucleoside phosphorylase
VGAELDDPYRLAEEAAVALAVATGVERHDVAVVLGSGWYPAADLLGRTVADVAVTELPGFSPPAVVGHAGRLRSVLVDRAQPPTDDSTPDDDGTLRALVFLGRTHWYEGRGVAAVVHAVRTAAAAGCRVVVLTNGCGSLDPAWPAGTPVLISDHLNLTGRSPLVGARFIDLTDLYSARLRARCRELDPDLPEGVYAQFPGPQYETPAEVRMARVLGASLVGMSTALEAIAAREAGLEVLGLSLVTNLAAGMSGEPLRHEEVLAAGTAAAERMGALLAGLLPLLVEDATSGEPGGGAG